MLLRTELLLLPGLTFDAARTNKAARNMMTGTRLRFDDEDGDDDRGQSEGGSDDDDDADDVDDAANADSGISVTCNSLMAKVFALYDANSGTSTAGNGRSASGKRYSLYFCCSHPVTEDMLLFFFPDPYHLVSSILCCGVECLQFVYCFY